MARTAQLTEKVGFGNGSLGGALNITDELEISMDVTVAIAASDFQVNVGIDVSELALLGFYSDQDLTIETNNGTTPDDTFTLTAGVIYIWRPGKVDACILTTDVTALFVTNSSGVEATLSIYALVEATP